MAPETLLILAALAVYRGSQLFVLDDGPFRFCARLREWACHLPCTHPLRHLLCGYEKPPRDGILFCPYCCSVWLAMVAAGYLWLGGIVSLWSLPFAVFGLSGAGCFLERMSGHY